MKSGRHQSDSEQRLCILTRPIGKRRRTDFANGRRSFSVRFLPPSFLFIPPGLPVTTSVPTQSAQCFASVYSLYFFKFPMLRSTDCAEFIECGGWLARLLNGPASLCNISLLGFFSWRYSQFVYSQSLFTLCTTGCTTGCEV